MAVRSPLARRPRFLLPVVVVLVVLIIAGFVFVNLYTDLLFFRSVNFSSVFEKVLGTRVVLFLIFGLIMALAVGATLMIAYRLRPSIRPLSLEQQNLERYRILIEPYHGWLVAVVSALSGIFAGLSASGRWKTYLLWANGQSFGTKDPQFHRDISYFMFTYPFQRFLLGFAFTVVVVTLLMALVTHYLFGGIRLQTQRPGGEGHPGGEGPPVGDDRPLRDPQGNRVLPRPVRARFQPARQGHGGLLHRHPRGVAGQDHPAVHQHLVRGAVHLQHPPARLDPPGPVVRHPRHQLAGHRRPVPDAHPVLLGPPERVGEGEAVHRAQHHGDARGVRHQQR